WSARRAVRGCVGALSTRCGPRPALGACVSRRRREPLCPPVTAAYDARHRTRSNSGRAGPRTSRRAARMGAHMILDRFRIDGQVAVVTGAGRGLGRAIAVAYAEAGADVVIVARTKQQLDEVAEQVAASGRSAHVVLADLADAEATAALAGIAVDRFGRLDIVVNTVGGALPSPLLDTTPEAMTQAFGFNVANAHALIRAAVPHMLATAGGGSIVNMTSAMGRLPGRAFAAYGTAKAALAHYTRLAAMDLNPRIRVN